MAASGTPPGNEKKGSTAKIRIAAGLPITSPDPFPAIILTPSTSRWIQQDLNETREMLRAFWSERIIKYDKEATDEFKKYLLREHFKNSSAGEKILDKIFKDAPLSFDKFCSSIQQFPLRFIHNMNKAEDLVPHKELKEIVHRIEKTDIDELLTHINEEKISASIAMRGDTGELVVPDMPENKSSYAMHSVGKVFTGMLVLRMIQEGIIAEAALKEPLDDDFIKTLPISLQTHLRENQITLHQLMTHQAGLGDYLGKYVSTISGALEMGIAPPKINQPHDFLKFAEDKTFPIGKEHYSNLGILLVGLAIKTAYEKQHGSYDYDEILRRYIIDDANMSCFSSRMPEGSRYNPEDKIAPHIVGGPAGGYWTTAEDLAKFGKWIYERCVTDAKDTSDRPKLKKLIEGYGQEFYHPHHQCVAHGGAIPTSSAFLRVSLATGSFIYTELAPNRFKNFWKD